MLASPLFVMSALILFTVAVPNASGTTDGANIIDGGGGVGAAKPRLRDTRASPGAVDTECRRRWTASLKEPLAPGLARVSRSQGNQVA